MEEVPENDKESSHSAHASGRNECYTKRGESDDFEMPSPCVAMLQTGDLGGEKHLLLTETPVVN
jgi:hypothetical protein